MGVDETAAGSYGILLLTIGAQPRNHFPAPSLRSLPGPVERLGRVGFFFTGDHHRRLDLPGRHLPLSSTYASMYNGITREGHPQRPLLAHILQQHGYQTAAFSANPNCGARVGLDRGFDTFAELPPAHATPLPRPLNFRGATLLLAQRPVQHILWPAGIRILPPDVYDTADQVTHAAIDWLIQAGEAPKFLWLHYMDLHWPYHRARRLKTAREAAHAWQDKRFINRYLDQRGQAKPTATQVERWRQVYQEELAFIDEQIGRLVEHLQATHQWQHTALVLTSDHGTEFMEHGNWGHYDNRLYDEGIRVPLLLRIPGLPGPQEIGQQVSLLDVAPTILALAGASRPEPMLGGNLLTLLDGTGDLVARSGDTRRPADVAYTEMLALNSAKFRLAIRTEEHKYIHDVENPHANQLYHLQTDPAERHNRYRKEDPVSHHFDGLRLAHFAPVLPQLLEVKDRPAGKMGPVTDPEIAERLRAMGYLE
jgi:arylsulfatase A-like enzyme